MTALIDRVAGLLEDRSSRRGFLARVAVVGSALAVGPVRFLTRPGTAYAAVCGTDSTCDSGYTTFCVTINNGVNRCPPGSLVGGWWKSDGSGFCCGNARYYLDCHSFCACGCGGVNFCGEGCRNCSCGCGPAGQCDQRKVCCNEFRYGQCNQGTDCTGPVWCRVVTCTPPWQVAAWSCTSTSATDQRTNSQSAPGLQDCTPIGSKYTALGGQGGLLGEPRTAETALPGGAARTLYDGGAVYWSPVTGAHEVHGAVAGTYAALGAEAGPIGLPVTDELPTPDGRGRYNDFSGSSGATIIYTGATGAHAVYGAIRAKWNELGSQAGPLGYPTTDELPTADGRGRFNDFAGTGGATIMHSPQTGSHAVYGAIKLKWNELGSQSGPVGYPVTDELPTSDGQGRYNDFDGSSGATIVWTPTTGARAVYGAIRATWNGLGSQAGVLGYPTTDEADAPGGTGRYNDFRGGSVYWSAATGAHGVTGPIRRAWLARSGAAGPLRLPTSDPSDDGPDRVRQNFQGGFAVLDTRTGTVTVTLT